MVPKGLLGHSTLLMVPSPSDFKFPFSNLDPPISDDLEPFEDEDASDKFDDPFACNWPETKKWLMKHLASLPPPFEPSETD